MKIFPACQELIITYNQAPIIFYSVKNTILYKISIIYNSNSTYKHEVAFEWSQQIVTVAIWALSWENLTE